jgi:hypothetical protein
MRAMLGDEREGRRGRRRRPDDVDARSRENHLDGIQPQGMRVEKDRRPFR